MKNILVILCGILLVSCTSEQKNVQDLNQNCEKILYILPLDDVSLVETFKYAEDFENYLNRIIPNNNFYITSQLCCDSVDIYYKQPTPKGKFFAKEILKKYKGNSDEQFLLLTHRDICANVHNISNYGILGYTIKSRNASIVSDKRLSNKKDITKVMIHEFLHLQGLNHCQNDTCLMCDGRGKGDFHNKRNLCNFHKKQINSIIY